MVRSLMHSPIRIVFVVGFLMMLMAGTASAEPVAIRTTPLDGEILQKTPTAVGVSFDVPLDAEQSTFRLLHPDGSDVTDTSITWGADNSSITLNLPANFADGVYTITWHAVAASDGSASNGWSSFSVGNPEDANILTIPTSASGHSGPPTWLQAGVRGIALTGIAISLSIWPIWRGVLRPSLAVSRAAAKPVTRRWQNVAWIGLAIALVGSLAELVTHSLAARDASMIDAVMQTVGHDDWGFWWLTRMALLVLLGLALAISPWWNAKQAPFNNGFLWIVSLAIPVPLILSGHAVEDEVGRETIVVMNYLHELSLALLLGLALGIVITVRSLTVAGASVLRKRAIWLAITAISIAGMSGYYLGTVFAGNTDAFTQTTYGGFMFARFVVGVIAVVIAIALLIRPFKLRVSRMLAGGLAAALVLVMLGTAAMDVVPPARADLLEQSVQTQSNLEFDGRPGILLIAPGQVGVNHLRLETPGTYLQTETEVFLELTSPSHSEIGTKTVQMYRVQGNAFEHHGTEFSLLGDWDITVRIEEPGFPASASNLTLPFGEENSTVSVPENAWKFDTLAGFAGIGLLLAGVLAIATAIVVPGGPLRKEAGGLGAVGLALALVVIMQGRIDPLLVVESGEGAIDANDMVMVARGEDVFATYCLSCHGVNLRGDGPLAENLNPPPSDFDAPHTRIHPNADLIYWIQNGIQGTAMPGFNSQLTDQEIRDVIAFIQNWQQNPEAAAATPELGVCEVEPLAFSDIPTLFHDGVHPETRRGTPLVRSGESNVSPDVSNDVMWTIEQMVNCSNQDVFMSELRLYTPQMLQEIYPQGASYDLTSESTSPIEPVSPENAITIQDVQSMSYLADGRIAVTVIFNDSAGVGVIPGADPVYQVTLIFVNVDGAWLIDEIR